MLYLLMDVGPDIYAVATAAVVEVVPCAALKSAPCKLAALAGILNYRGQPVPVMDAGVLLADRPCPLRFSTRIIVQRVEIGGRERLLGLVGENITRVRQFAESDFVEPGARAADFPITGRVAVLGDRWVQRLHLESVIPDELWAILTEEGA